MINLKFFEKLDILTLYQYRYLRQRLSFLGDGKKRTRIANILATKKVLSDGKKDR